MVTAMATYRSIRTALLRALPSESLRPELRVRTSQSLLPRASKLDVVVLNGHLHGYVIAMNVEDLLKVPIVIEGYRGVLEKMSLVVPLSIRNRALEMLPAWLGLKYFQVGPRGGIHFIGVRRCTINADFNRQDLAYLLQVSEAREWLARLWVFPVNGESRRQAMASRLAATVEPAEIKAGVFSRLRSRWPWQPTPCRGHGSSGRGVGLPPIPWRFSVR